MLTYSTAYTNALSALGEQRMSTTTTDTTPDATTTTETENRTMSTSAPTLTIPLPFAVDGFGAVLPHASKDESTPVITMIQATQSATGAVALFATDRFTVGRYIFPTPDENAESLGGARYAEIDGRYAPHATHPEDTATLAGAVAVLIPRAAAEYVAKLKPANVGGRDLRRGAGVVRFTFAPGAGVDGRGLGPVTVDVLAWGDVVASATFTAPPAFATSAANLPPVARLFPTAADLTAESGEAGASVALEPLHVQKVTTWAKAARKDARVIFHTRSNDAGGNKLAPVVALVGRRFAALIQPSRLDFAPTLEDYTPAAEIPAAKEA